jgi:DNA polymerase-3 subunit alpha|nr:MAG TPA: REP HELICASE [Caudoviricetes sp.]
MEYKINDVLFFDTETTGVPARGKKWDKDFNEFPYIAQLAWLKDGELHSHVIKPIDPKGVPYEIPEEVVKIHGISTEIAMQEGAPFVDVIQEFIKDCGNSPLVCAHNIYFDTSIIKANIMRYLGQEYYDSVVDAALFKGKRVDTMMKTIKFVQAKFADGRVGKFPTLKELYAKCFDGKTFNAHDAGEDVKALAACLPVLVEKGIVELKQKEYNEEGKPTHKEEKKADVKPTQKMKIGKAQGIFDDEPVQMPTASGGKENEASTGAKPKGLNMDDF